MNTRRGRRGDATDSRCPVTMWRIYRDRMMVRFQAYERRIVFLNESQVVLRAGGS